MPEDGEIVHEEHHADANPAQFDQQVAHLRDLLPQAKAFAVCLLIPDENWSEEHQSCYTHVVIGSVPGIATIPFLRLAIKDIVETANDMITRSAEEVEDE